ncbi:peptide-methionine (S)-S-oxide reductase MsrA [Paracidovorax citrulli]
MTNASDNMAAQREVATLGGGCFWCLEAVYQQVEGVLTVESGYTGGHVDDPSYEQVCSGETGHAEVVRLAFDPSIISYREILEIFFAIHDPTTLNRQGNDVGTQYRSVIYTHSDEQRRTAEAVMADLAAQQLYDGPFVTRIEPEQTYWAAEPYHQNYWRTHPGQGYCAFVITPKVSKFRQRFAQRLRGDVS